jgi:hypothetical protein
MTLQAERATTPAGAAPARIDLEQFIEAVSRGVVRAQAAQDDVAGHALRPVHTTTPVIAGLVVYCPTIPAIDPKNPYPIPGPVREVRIQ